MSLLAATLIASSAFAVDNIKVSGDAKLFYSTNDGINSVAAFGHDKDASLFRQENSAGQAGLSVGVTADLTEGVSAGITANALSTLGLENNLVSNVWEGTTANTGTGAVGPLNIAGLKDQFWFSNAWIAGTVGKTTGKIGRMELDTPLVFSETWSMYANTFEAAVLINQDIPDTTLVGAYVGGSNGSEGGSIGDQNAVGTRENNSFGGVLAGGQDTVNSPFHSFYQGAYAAGAVNNSWEPLTVQAWYFQAQHLLNAYWLQADLAMDMGLLVGAQYTGLSETAVLSNKSGSAFAVMAGYEMKDTFKITAAFSQTGNDATALNVGANLAASGQSKLYTESWWNYGYVTAADTTAFNITVSTPEALTWAELALYYTSADQADGGKKVGAGNKGVDMSEITVSASKSFGPLDTSLVYVSTTADDTNFENPTDTKGSSFNTIQAYLTYNF